MKQMKMETTNSRILHVFIFLGVLFACLAGYLTWFELQGKTDIMQSAYNRRLQKDEDKILRGSILDRNGICLAKTQTTEGIRQRVYPFGKLYAHVIGYDSQTYGKTLLEARYNDQLLGQDGLELVDEIGSMISGKKRVGYNIYLTIDNSLQQRARELMGNKHGAVVAMNPKTGAILAMVSAPDYDPNSAVMQQKWATLIEDENNPLLPRAVMGLYPPGSTFKVLTAAAAVENGLADMTIDDKGRTVIDGMVIRNHSGKAYGRLDLIKAFTVSSNVYFAQMAGKIGAGNLVSEAKKAGFGRNFPFDIPLTVSRIGDAGMSETELAATGIGQGKVLATPLQMAMVSAGVANAGKIMKPYLVGDIVAAGGKVVHRKTAQELYSLMDASTAEKLTEMMKNVVSSGTGTRARISGYTVAGKTGTAENEKSSQGEGYDHAWFIGFAPAEDPEIAVAVILEYEGQGGGIAAAPIAGKVMASWLESQH